MKQIRSATKRHQLDPKQYQALLEQLLPVGDGAAPDRVAGWTRKGVWARLQADYPNGFGLTVFFDKYGDVSSCKASLPTIKIARANL